MVATDNADIERHNQPKHVRENFSGPTALALILVCLVLAAVFIGIVTMAR